MVEPASDVVAARLTEGLGVVSRRLCVLVQYAPRPAGVPVGHTAVSGDVEEVALHDNDLAVVVSLHLTVAVEHVVGTVSKELVFRTLLFAVADGEYAGVARLDDGIGW